MPQEAALGLMMNISVANAWKTIPTIQAVGVAVGGKDSFSSFSPTLFGKEPDLKHQIRSSLEEMKRSGRK